MSKRINEMADGSSVLVTWLMVKDPGLKGSRYEQLKTALAISHLAI
jgi:hypothetical protein